MYTKRPIFHDLGRFFVPKHHLLCTRIKKPRPWKPGQHCTTIFNLVASQQCFAKIGLFFRKSALYLKESSLSNSRWGHVWYKERPPPQQVGKPNKRYNAICMGHPSVQHSSPPWLHPFSPPNFFQRPWLHGIHHLPLSFQDWIQWRFVWCFWCHHWHCQRNPDRKSVV